MLKFILLATPILSNAAKCHICGTKGNAGLKYPSGYLESVKSTCAAHAVKVFSTKNVDCDKETKKAAKCCDGSILQPLPPSPQPIIPNIPKTGSQPICHLCRDGSLPTDKHHVIHMLYIGAGTCEQYWKAGRQGLIPAHLCDPLKFFARDPCGCKQETKPPNSIPNPIKAATRGGFEFKSERSSWLRAVFLMLQFTVIGLMIGLLLSLLIHMIM